MTGSAEKARQTSFMPDVDIQANPIFSVGTHIVTRTYGKAEIINNPIEAIRLVEESGKRPEFENINTAYIKVLKSQTERVLPPRTRFSVSSGR